MSKICNNPNCEHAGKLQPGKNFYTRRAQCITCYKAIVRKQKATPEGRRRKPLDANDFYVKAGYPFIF